MTERRRVNAAQKRLYFRDFGHVPRLGYEFVEGARLGLVECDAQAHLDLVAERAPIDHRTIGADDADGAQPIEPPRTGGRREPGARGKLRRAKMGGVLILAQQAAVDIVEHDFPCSSLIYELILE